MSVTMALTSEIIERLKGDGARLVGISNIERFDGAPRGHHPQDFVPGAKSVVVFGLPLLHLTLNWEEHLVDSEFVSPNSRQEVLQTYFGWRCSHDLVDDLLDMMALRLSHFLEDRGCLSLFFPSNGPYRQLMHEKVSLGRGLFSHRHAAVRAGLGEFGLNNLVVTPQYGPRVRFGSVITEAELTPSPLLEVKTCLGESCSICVESCPGPISMRSNFDPKEVWYQTPAQTDIESCRKLHQEHYCLTTCIKVCPVGNASSKKKEETY